MNSNAGGATGALDTFERELRRAASLLEQGRFEQAYTWAAEALALRPAHLLAQNLLGLILYQQHRFGPALEVFEALVRKNPDVITLRMNAGLSALHGDQLERTLEHLRRAVDLDPHHQRAFAALAVAHLRRGETHLARAALLEAGLEASAARFSESVDSQTAQELESELLKQAEARLPTTAPSPCEGFAEVTALVPLDEWRQADLVSSQPEVPALGPESPVEELVAEPEAGEAPPGPDAPPPGAEQQLSSSPPEEPVAGLPRPAAELPPTPSEAIGAAPAQVEPSRPPEMIIVVEPGRADQEDTAGAQAAPAKEQVAAAAPPVEPGPEPITLEAEPAQDGEDIDAAMDALAVPAAEPSSEPLPSRPAEEPSAASDRPDLPAAPVVAIEEGFDPGPTPISLVETWSAPTKAPAALGHLLPGAAVPDQRSKERRRLAERLASMSLPGLERGPDAAIRYGALIVRLDSRSRGALIRIDHLILDRGDLRWRAASRRRKGADAGPFVVDGAALQIVTGDGLLVLRGPRAGQLELLNLDEEGLYVRETLLLAASADLHWENGRLPGLNEEPRFVHLRGSGYLVLAGTERVFSLPLAEGQTLRIRLQHLLGWSGATVPQLSTEEGIVGFTGSGMLLLQLA